MLSGQRPFAGSSAGALYLRTVSEDAPDIRSLVPDTPPALAAALARSLTRDPADRFQSAAAMARALGETAASASEQTVVLPSSSPAASEAFDRKTVDTIERKLVEHVGPIARYLVTSAARTAGSVDALCLALAANIERPADRDRFTREVHARLQSGSSLVPGSALSLPDTELQVLQAALTRYLGPVSRVLIKRAAPQAVSMPALWQTLAEHIEQPADREAFLRQAPGRG